MKEYLKSLTKFEMGLILLISVINIALGFMDGSNTLIGVIASITGVACVVMTAKGHISCYYFGLINILAYVYISYMSKYYGEVMLNGLYYLPMQFVGIAMWKKHMNKESNLVKGKVMSKKQIALLAVISVVCIAIYSLGLQKLNGNLPVFDAMSTVLSVFAMYLSVKMYAEQWLLWIVVDVVTVAMWVFSVINNEPNAMVMVVMWTAYLINAIYGYINWRNLAKQEEVHEECV